MPSQTHLKRPWLRYGVLAAALIACVVSHLFFLRLRPLSDSTRADTPKIKPASGFWQAVITHQ